MVEQQNINWQEVSDKLPFERTPESKARRDKIWNYIDVNGNSYVSLAEVDKGLRDVLQLDAVFNCKKAIIRAFNASKHAVKTKSKHGPDYIERAEFRLLLQYLRQYYEYYQAFARIDTGDDNRVDLKEFIAAKASIEKWVGKIADPVAEFNKIDKNGGGQILFDEFCEWAIAKNLDLEDDDD